MDRTGVVTASSLNVRTAPSTDAARVETIPRGTEVTIVDQHDGWYRISVPETGWVSSSYVVLDPPMPDPGEVTPLSPFDGPLGRRPRNLAEVNEMFGDPTRGGIYVSDADPTWRAHNIVELHGPDAFLPVLAASYFPIHHDIEPYAREAFRRADAAIPGYVQRPGTWGYNFRHMRHNPKLPLSYHSWGIAIDVNPDANPAITFGPGEYPPPWSAGWTARWPKGIPRAVVAAFESCGFTWGGHWTDYCDPMHFQWLGPETPV